MPKNTGVHEAQVKHYFYSEYRTEVAQLAYLVRACDIFFKRVPLSFMYIYVCVPVAEGGA